MLRSALLASSAALALATQSCPVNSTFFPPLTCPDNWSCCSMPTAPVCATAAPPCNVCAECCHNLTPTQCTSCVQTQCAGKSTIGDMGCNTTHSSTWVPYNEYCCGRGVPLVASKTLPNCLLIGDSVTAGLFPVAQSLLAQECQVQLFENVDAAAEAACWGAHTSAAPDGSVVEWDVIVFNEGLHSLWPRVNTSAELQQWTGVLSNWTRVLASGPLAPTLVYATMTPFMPQKWCNPPNAQADVEAKNAAAVAAVRAAGVSMIEDRYAVITGYCGELYNNCSWCDNEAQYQCAAYVQAGGFCGFHYVQPGWNALGNSTATVVRAALAERRARGLLRW